MIGFLLSITKDLDLELPYHFVIFTKEYFKSEFRSWRFLRKSKCLYLLL